MHIVVICAPHLKHLGSLRGSELTKAISKTPPKVIDCLHQIGLNFLYSDLSGIKAKKSHIKRKLAPHKKELIKLAHSKSRKQQRQILKRRGGGLAVSLLTLLSSVILAVAAAL